MSSILSKFIKKFKRSANCPEKDKCLEIMSLVIDGEADSDQRNFVHSHVKSCMPCSNEYEVEKAMRELLQQKCTCEAPEGLAESIKTKLN